MFDKKMYAYKPTITISKFCPDKIPVHDQYRLLYLNELQEDIHKSSYLEGDILNMYTIQKAHRKGISSLILDKLLSEAKVMGITKVTLHTSTEGEKLYRKIHFTKPVYPYIERTINA